MTTLPLQEGIQAAKAGDHERARALLLPLVEQDEENEQAWLWLSGVMPTWEERRICLENVLTLNPDNEMAQRGMARLQAMAPADWNSPVDQKIVTAVSPAAAVLYPDRQTKLAPDQFLPEDNLSSQPRAITFIQDSRYNDVWTSGQTLCGYCATPVHEDDNNCPKCQKKLYGWRHRYPQPTARLYNFVVVLSGLTLFLITDTFLDISLQYDTRLIVLHGLLSLVFLTMIGGALVRHLWGQYGVIILSFFLLLLNGNLLFSQIQAGPYANMEGDVIEQAFLISVSLALKGMQMLAAAVLIGYGIFAVSSEFDRVKMHFTAQVDRSLRDSSEFHSLARVLAGEGLWASAILHWQYAAAHAPNHAQFQRELGAAYARLGFHERSLDVLQSALVVAGNPAVKAEITALIDDIRHNKPIK